MEKRIPGEGQRKFRAVMEKIKGDQPAFDIEEFKLSMEKKLEEVGQKIEKWLSEDPKQNMLDKLKQELLSENLRIHPMGKKITAENMYSLTDEECRFLGMKYVINGMIIVNFENLVENVKTLQSLDKKKENKKSSIDNLNDLFVDQKAYELGIETLLWVKPPVINENLMFLLGSRQKGAISAWIDALSKKGKIRKAGDAELAILLNKAFSGLNLGADGKTLRNPGTTSYIKYHKQFLELIP